MNVNRKILPHRKYLAFQSVIVFITVYFISRPFLATFFESNSQAIRVQVSTNLFLVGLSLIIIPLVLHYFFKKGRYTFLKTLLLALAGGGGGLIGLALLLLIIRFF